MVAPSLRVLLAEKKYSETGLTLRSLCAEAGWSPEIVFVESRAELEQALPTHCPDVALVQLAVLQPDAPASLSVLHFANPSVPFILFGDPADKACAVTCLSMGPRTSCSRGLWTNGPWLVRFARPGGGSHWEQWKCYTRSSLPQK